MPTGFLCRLLDSNEYLTTPAEQKAIYTELERRGEECVDHVQKVIAANFGNQTEMLI
jgi:hypothetical protein